MNTSFAPPEVETGLFTAGPTATGATDQSAKSAAYEIVTSLVAVVLLAAAMLKSHQLIDEWRTGFSPVRHQLYITATAALEYVVATWLLSGFRRAWARSASLALLSIYVGVAGAHLVSGDSNCGCFGRLTVHPALTASFDLGALLLILYLGRHQSGRSIKRPSYTIRMFVAVLASSTIAVLIVPFAFDPPAREMVMLEPNPAVGSSFQLIGYLQEADRIKIESGRNVVVFFSAGCGKCEAALQVVDQRRMWGASATSYWAINIDAPVAGTQIGRGRTFHAPFPELHLRPNVLCVTEVPWAFTLLDGRVESSAAIGT